MDKRLNDILGRLVARRDAGALGDDDYAYLAGLVARAAPSTEGDDAARPLWHWVRARAAAWEVSWFELTALVELGEAVDALLSDAGAAGVPYESSVARWAAPVTREGLRRALRRHLATDLEGAEEARAVAALVVGLAGFDDLAPLLVSALQSALAGRREWWDDAVHNALRSLTVLDHPSMRELAPRYARHDNGSLRSAARAWAARHADALTPAELAAVFTPHHGGEGAAYADLLAEHPDVAERVMARDVDVMSALKSALEADTVSLRGALGVTRLAVSAKAKDIVKAWLADGDVRVRGAAALAVFGAKAKWARAAVHERLGEGGEDDEGVQSCLAAAAVAVDGDPDAKLTEMLSHERASLRVGAVWACLGRDGGVAKARERLRDDDGDVRAAAAAVVMAAAHPDAPDAMDLVMLPVLDSEHDWRKWLALRALEGAEVPASPVVEDHDLSEAGLGPDRFERARAFYAEHPDLLYRAYGADAMGTLQSLHDAEAARHSLESDLESATDRDVATRLWLELACVGGPRTASGRLRGALLEARPERKVALDEASFVPAVVLALRGGSLWRAGALRALASTGARVEALLSSLVRWQVDDETTRDAVLAALEVDHHDDPVLDDARTLLTDPGASLAGLAHLAWLEMKLDDGHKVTLAQRLADPAVPDRDATPLLAAMAGDDHDELSAAAFASLHARHATAPWMAAAVDLRSRSGSWTARRQAAEIMGRAGDERVVPRLLEALQDDDSDVQNAAVQSLIDVASRHPALGLSVLDIRDPELVRARLGLSEDVDYGKDGREEALRLLLLGLDARKDAALARKHRGRKVVVARVTAAGADEHAPVARPMSSAEFEALALYLKVDFADDETGSIVADVHKEPSGEALSALLQTDSLVVASASWS